MTTIDIGGAKRAAILWVALFIFAMFATAGLLASTNVIPSPWRFTLLVFPMLLMIPMTRATERMRRMAGSDSPAAVRYSRRMLAASFAYVLGFAIALTLLPDVKTEKPAAALLSLLPTLPILGMIGAMARYVIEEEDEYLRARAIYAGLIATGLLLAIATFWGFLSSFGVVPDAPAWAAVPVWAVGLGVGQLAGKVRGT